MIAMLKSTGAETASGLARTACLLAFVFSLVGWVEPAGAQGKRAVEQPCRAATAPVRYGRILRVPRTLRAEVAAYRRAWAAVCKRGGGASLHDLLVRAERIKRGFVKLLQKQQVHGKAVDRLHTQLSKTYPTFIPAMEGSIMEFEFFEPMLDVFKAHVRLGNEGDKLYFRHHAAVFGTDFKAPPWIKRTWDYGGCIMLGATYPSRAPHGGFDFVGAADRIAMLKRRIRGAWYRDKLNGIENQMRAALIQLAAPQRKKDGKPLIDACGPRPAALVTLHRTADGLEKRTGWSKEAKAVRRAIARIDAGEIRLCEKASCPGG